MVQSAQSRITEAVTAWPGVTAATGRFGELAFRAGGREIGHLHGDREAHFSFQRELAASLRAAGRITDHPIFPGKPALAARSIETEADVADVVALMRLNYDAAVSKGAA